MMKKIGLVFLLYLFWSPCGFGQDTYRTERYVYQIDKERVHHAKLDDDHLTVLGVRIGLDTLDTVQETFGKATELSRGEHQSKKICYASKSVQSGPVVVFEAGALGGWKTITAFRILSGDFDFKQRANCAVNEMIGEDVKTKSGIGIGTRKSDLMKILGTPTLETDERLLYLYEFKERMNEKQIAKFAMKLPSVVDNPYFDVNSDIEAIFSSSKLVSVVVNKTESY